MCRLVNITMDQNCWRVLLKYARNGRNGTPHKETGQGLVSIKQLFHSISLMEGTMNERTMKQNRR